MSVSVSSFRIFRTCHRSLSPSVKSTNRQASVISSVQDTLSHCKLSEVKYTAPQQLGVMGKKYQLYFFSNFYLYIFFYIGMESLACSISYWEDALLAFSGNNLNSISNRLMSTEDSQFCKELQLLVDSAYSLQDQCQLLFLDQVRI